MKLLASFLIIAGIVGSTANGLASEPRIEVPLDRTGCTRGGTSNSSVNHSGVAWLSWDDKDRSPGSNLGFMPAEVQYLFVRLANLDELSGYELHVRWTPPASPSVGCYTLIGNFPHYPLDDPDPWRGGDDRKGHQDTRPVYECGSDYWREVSAFSQCYTKCSDGYLSRGLFNFSYCSTAVPGRFYLEHVKVTDCDGRITNLGIVGDATILGGEGEGAPLHVKSSTWGAVKLLYGENN